MQSNCLHRRADCARHLHIPDDDTVNWAEIIETHVPYPVGVDRSDLLSISQCDSRLVSSEPGRGDTQSLHCGTFGMQHEPSMRSLAKLEPMPRRNIGGAEALSSLRQMDIQSSTLFLTTKPVMCFNLHGRSSAAFHRCSMGDVELQPRCQNRVKEPSGQGEIGSAAAQFPIGGTAHEHSAL